MIQRKFKQIRTGHLVRSVVTVTGEECPQTGQVSYQHQQLFMQWLAANPTLLICGMVPFEKLSIKHNGQCWEASAEATTEEP